IVNLIVPLLFALLLNEVRVKWFKRTVQTMVYLPHFLSWVILAGMFTSNIFSLDGMVNSVLGVFGIEPVFFMASNFWFRPIIVLTDVWKEFGFGTIVYLAAITGLDPGQYESAVIDGANRMQKVLYITIPGIAATIVLLGTLSLGNVLNANFDQIFNMYNTMVLKTGDIIDTYVYRSGLLGAKYGLATAVGLMKSVISFILIMTSYKLADKFANYRIF
ncbi:sugar ABC transporter permease, partial [Candidatus Nomurabacteria bacterium]|nr:sugar ABC transporter permease [Candidatus Nomurabacteria bacterium]